MTYDYNLDDTLKTKTLKNFHNPNDSTRPYVLKNDTYDDAGNRIQTKTDNNKTTTAYTLDSIKRVLTETLGPTELQRKTIYVHDLASNMTSEQNTDD